MRKGQKQNQFFLKKRNFGPKFEPLKILRAQYHYIQCWVPSIGKTLMNWRELRGHHGDCEGWSTF